MSKNARTPPTPPRQVTIVQEFGPELLIHSKKTIPGHGTAGTKAEVRVTGLFFVQWCFASARRHSVIFISVRCLFVDVLLASKSQRFSAIQKLAWVQYGMGRLDLI